MLLQPFELILAADIVNDVGLSEMVYRMLQLYLAPRGLFIMVCPKAVHRHCIDQLRALLVDSVELDVKVCDVPDWTREGLDEAQTIEHELIFAQWIDGRRGANTRDAAHAVDVEASGVGAGQPLLPALGLEAPAKL